MVVEAEDFAQLFFLKGILFVNLVSENDEGHILKLGHLEQRVQLFFGLRETLVITCINEENDTIEE